MGDQSSQTFSERQVNSIAFSPDGKNILIARKNKTAILRSIDSSLLQTTTYNSDVKVTLSPDRKSLLTSSGRRYIPHSARNGMVK